LSPIRSRLMIRKRGPKQVQMEFITIEEMVPEDHLLRVIDRTIDFSFVQERLYPLYCPDNGRPGQSGDAVQDATCTGYGRNGNWCERSR
jgi:hypothetical protein